jgi:hypothetical protein
MAKAKPQDVAAFHAEYDTQTDHRLHVFAALSQAVPQGPVLYAGSYVDIAPSVYFGDVRYVDTDKRAARFFSEAESVRQLVAAKQAQVGCRSGGMVRFDHQDYRTPLDLQERSVTLLISLFAGFISDTCTRYLATGGHLFVNDSHGDASLASLDPHYRLVGVMLKTGDCYEMSTRNLGAYFIAKRGLPPTAASLHASGRGPVYTERPFAYLFERTA